MRFGNTRFGGKCQGQMKRTSAQAIIVAAAITACAGIARAQSTINTPISTTGWNTDIILNTGQQTSSTLFDTIAGWTLYENGFNGNTTGGLPASGTIQSNSNSGTTFQLQPYTANTNNAIWFNNANASGNLVNGPVSVPTPAAPFVLNLSSPAVYGSLAFLATAANGGSIPTITYQLNFAGAAPATGTFVVSDWFNSATTPLPYAINSLDRIRGAGGGYAVEFDGTNPVMYEYDVTIPAADSTKVLTSNFVYQLHDNQRGSFCGHLRRQRLGRCGR